VIALGLVVCPITRQVAGCRNIARSTQLEYPFILIVQHSLRGCAMERREILALTGAALLLGGNRAQAQAQTGAGAAATDAKVVRVFATPDGGSRVEELVIAPGAKAIPVTNMTASVYNGTGARAPDWHTAPRKQFAINMTGELEVEVSDGTRRRIGSDLVYLEDTTGKGHVTRALGPITNVFIHVPDDFDIVAWTQGG
jgi:quercetin dioxygenase-like cupin family protein